MTHLAIVNHPLLMDDALETRSRTHELVTEARFAVLAPTAYSCSACSALGVRDETLVFAWKVEALCSG